MLDVTIWTPSAREDEDRIEITDVDFISLVNHDTYGKPAIISDEEHKNQDVRVVYINPNNIAAVEVHKQ